MTGSGHQGPVVILPPDCLLPSSERPNNRDHCEVDDACLTRLHTLRTSCSNLRLRINKLVFIFIIILCIITVIDLARGDMECLPALSLSPIPL